MNAQEIRETIEQKSNRGPLSSSSRKQTRNSNTAVNRFANSCDASTWVVILMGACYYLDDLRHQMIGYARPMFYTKVEIVQVCLAFGERAGKAMALAGVGLVDTGPADFDAAQIANETSLDIFACVFVGHESDS
ncbi:hypothetical protein BLA29_001647 [Euroglyphus maynei]|uniref:Uncharacterized protein n=1 Tax=Euroglyphus maynei TaxID=6958 RepID=A0A1Y3BEM0_EURMA|nr:hypothetical protein BLA29_001647 [Euroglyphus maynei]